MLRRTLIYAVGALLFLVGMRYATTVQAHEAGRTRALSASPAPAVRSAGAALGLGPTLPAADFPDDPVAQHAYAAAAKIEQLLNQLPSECSRNRIGGATLLNCFQNRRASHCSACQREDYYAYRQSRDGKSDRQIRQGILQGAWKNVHLSSWKEPLDVKIAAIG